MPARGLPSRIFPIFGGLAAALPAGRFFRTCFKKLVYKAHADPSGSKHLV